MLSFFANKAELMRKTDPDHIYVENIRSFFNMPHKIAKIMCEMAVKEGIFEKRIGVKCPTCHRIIKSFSANEELPATIECIVCEMNEETTHEYRVSDLNKIEYYRLKR